MYVCVCHSSSPAINQSHPQTAQPNQLRPYLDLLVREGVDEGDLVLEALYHLRRHARPRLMLVLMWCNVMAGKCIY